MSKAMKSKRGKAKGRKRKANEAEEKDQATMKKPKSTQKEFVFNKVGQEAGDLNEHYNIICKYMDEFNWSSKDMMIYRRGFEKGTIQGYIKKNIEMKKSGLMYVWGHPGTGKSSIIRVIEDELNTEIKRGGTLENKLAIFNYNGMSFKKLYDFSVQLIKDIRYKFMGKPSHNLESQLKKTDDVVDLGHRIQNYFIEEFETHKLVIIDEVDNLSMTESAKNFVAFLHSVLKSDTNLTIIGIANSVDLLSKVTQYNSKEMELVEKKCIFEPYSVKDITLIVKNKQKWFEEKYKVKADYIEDKALEFVAKRISKVTGDIRTVFDMIKTALNIVSLKLKDKMLKRKGKNKGSKSDGSVEEERTDDDPKKSEEEEEKDEEGQEKSDSKKEEPKEADKVSQADTVPSFSGEEPYSINLEDPKVDFKLVLHLTNLKLGIKNTEIIKKLPSQLIITLKTIVYVFDERSSINKNIKVSELFTTNQKTLHKLWMPTINMSDFWTGLKTLESYGLITYWEGKNPKSGKVALKADLDEIKAGIQKTDLGPDK